MADLDFPDVQPETEEDNVGSGKERSSLGMTAGSTPAVPKRDDFVVLKYLGEGSVGAVMQVKHKETNEIYALKAVDKQRIEEHDLGERLLVEARVQMRVKHPNLLRCYNCFEDRGSIYLLLEYAEGGDLHRLIKTRGRLSEPDAAYILFQVAEGVQYLHNRGIIHRDLKAENILLDDNLRVKVADFGWCAEVEGRTTFCGTPCMLAPEMIQGKPYDRSVDIWSVGVLLFEMLCGSSPFDRGGGLLETCQNIVVVGLEEEQLKKTPEATHKLLQGLLHKEAESRMSLERVLRHRWVLEKRALQMGTPAILEGDEEEEDTASPHVGKEHAAASAQHFFVGTGGDLGARDTGGALSNSDHDVSWAVPPTNLVTNIPPTKASVMLSPVQSIDVLPSPANSLSPPSTVKPIADVSPLLALEETRAFKNFAEEDLESTFPVGVANLFDGKSDEHTSSQLGERLQRLDAGGPDLLRGTGHHSAEKLQSMDSEKLQPRIGKLHSLESDDLVPCQGAKRERLPPVTSAACEQVKIQPVRVERLQALDLTPPSSPRHQVSGEVDKPRGGYLMSFSSGNLSQYRPGSTQKLILPTEQITPALDPSFDITSPVMQSLPSRAPATEESSRSKLEILGRGVGPRDSPPQVERLPASPFSILRAAEEREATKKSSSSVSQNLPAYELPSTSRDLPRAKAPSAGMTGYRSKQQPAAPPPREAPRHGQAVAFRNEGLPDIRIVGNYEETSSQSSGGFREGRGTRHSDGFMESDAWMRQAEPHIQPNDNWLDKALKFIGLQPPDPEDELRGHMEKFGPPQFELLHQLITLGFDDRLSIEAVRRASSVEAAVEWILKNS